MSMAMIVLKNTPKGFKLIPVREVSGSKGLPIDRYHPLSQRVNEVIDFLIAEAKLRGLYRTSIKDLFGAITTKYGPDFFPDCKVLPAVGETPARLIIKN